MGLDLDTLKVNWPGHLSQLLFPIERSWSADALRGKELLKAFVILWIEQVYLLLIDHKLEITRFDDKVFGGVAMKHFNSIKSIKSVKSQMVSPTIFSISNLY